MAFTFEEKEQILRDVPTDVQDRARANDPEARAIVQQAVDQWKSRPAGVVAVENTQLTREKVMEMEDFGWDDVSGLINTGKLTDRVVEFAQGEGYALDQSLTGQRLINIGERKGEGHNRLTDAILSPVTSALRLVGNDPSGMDVDDFYKEVLKKPKGDWMRAGVERLIREQLQERQEDSEKAVKRYGERANIDHAGKAQAIAGQEVEVGNPREWFPASMQKTEEGKVVAKRSEAKRYRETLKEYDAYAWSQFEQLDDQGKREFLLQTKQSDEQMLERLNSLYESGRSHLHDPEVFDWAVRRGMEKPVDVGFWNAVKAAGPLLWQMAKGTGYYAGDYLKATGAAFTPWESDDEAISQFIAQTEGGFQALGADYKMLSGNAKGYFQDVVGKITKEDTPEGEEAFRKAKNERNRQFQLRALSNQAVYSSIAHDIASKWWVDPQRVNDTTLASTIWLDATNLIPIGGVGKKAADAALKAGVEAMHSGTLRVAKNAADDAAKAVSDAQGVLVSSMKVGDAKAIRAAQKKLDDVIKTSDEAADVLVAAQRKMSNQYHELVEAGAEKLSGHAIKWVGETAEWIMKKADDAMDKALVRMGPDMADSTRRMIEGGIKVGVAASLGGLGAGVAGVVGGILLGLPASRALARDMKLVGGHMALGSRLQPMHRALRATTDAGGNVIPQASVGTRGVLTAAELAFPVVDPLARYAGRVGSQLMSVQSLEAMAIQGAIGYLGSGGSWEGAVTGATIGAGFMGMASFVGGLTPFSTQMEANRVAAQNARHFRKQLEGTPTGDEFVKLAFEDQKAIAWAMGGFPDTAIKIIRDADRAPASYSKSRNEITLNVGSRHWRGEFARKVAKHEHSHFIARHVGVREKILNSLLGDTNTRRAGVFTKTDANGKAKYVLEKSSVREIIQGNLAGKTPEAIAQETGLSVEAVTSLGRDLTAADRRRDDVYAETTKEFDDLTAGYLALLLRDDPQATAEFSNMSNRELQEYMAEEIFAEHGAAQLTSYTPEYMKSFRRAAWAPGLDKVLGSSRMSGLSAYVLGGLGALMGKDKQVASSIFGDIDAIPEFQRIFDGYNHSRSMNREMELTDAGTGRGETLNPDDWDTSKGNAASTEALKQWVANGLVDVDPATGVPKGIEVQSDGTWRVKDPNAVRQSAAAAEKAAKEFGTEVRDWLENNSPLPRTAQDIKDSVDKGAPSANKVEEDALDAIKSKVDTGSKEEVKKEIRTQKAQAQQQSTKDYLDRIEAIVDRDMADDDIVAPRTTIDGRVLVSGRYLPEALIDHLEASGRFNPHQLENLRALNAYLKDGRHATPITVMYQSTMRGGKKASLSASERTVYVTGFEVTQQGNLIYRIWNVDKVMENGQKKMNSKVGKDLYAGDLSQFHQDVFTYFNNYANGLPGATGLSIAKRDFIRKAIGLGQPTTDQASGRVPNPYSWHIDSLKDAKGTALNSYRLDRSNWIDLGNPRQRANLDQPLTSREGPFPGSYQRIRENYSPGSMDDNVYLKLAEDPEGNRVELQKLVDKAAMATGALILDDSNNGAFQARRDKAPVNTLKAYKLFTTKDGELFPLFVGAKESLPTGVWLDAISGQEAKPSKSGRPQVKSKLGPLAYRPGWHAGDIPYASHIGVKDSSGKVAFRRKNEVWAEVEMAADVNYQPEADASPSRDIKKLPKDGSYRFKTNPQMTGEWIISGSMKINRVMGEDEVSQILKDHDVSPMPWEHGPLNLSDMGLNDAPLVNTRKLLDPVTYDDQGNVIPLSRRFDQSTDDIRYSPGPSEVDKSITGLIDSSHDTLSKGKKGKGGATPTGVARRRLWEESQDLIPETDEGREVRLRLQADAPSIPLRDIGNELRQSALIHGAEAGAFTEEDIVRLSILSGVPVTGDYVADLTNVINAANPDGSLVPIGGGSEALVFKSLGDNKVLKTRRIQIDPNDPNDAFAPFGITPDVIPQTFKPEMSMGSDLGALLALSDYSAVWGDPVKVLGFTEGMEFMLVEQDYVRPKKGDRVKNSDIAKKLLKEGWELKAVRPRDAFGNPISGNVLSGHFWMHPEKKALAMDTHEGNFIKAQDGELRPIDIPTRLLTDEEYEGVKQYHPGIKEEGVVSQENMPGWNSGILRGLHTAKESDRKAFHEAIQKALHYTKAGKSINIIAEEMGITTENLATGISFYMNSEGVPEMNPATQVAGIETLEQARLYALLHGYFTYQEAVAGYRPEYGLKPEGGWDDKKHIVDLIIRKKVKDDPDVPTKASKLHIKKISKIIDDYTKDMPPGEYGAQSGDIAYFLTDTGFRLMFLDLPSNPDVTPQVFADIVAEVQQTLKIKEGDYESATARSFYEENPWGRDDSGNAPGGRGQVYREAIASAASEAGLPDLLGRLERRLGPKLQEVYDRYAQKGLGNPGTQPGIVREVAGIRLPRTVSELSDADALTIANKVAPRRGDPYIAEEAFEIVDDYMAWDKLSAVEGDQFMPELKRVSKTKQADLMSAKKKGKESIVEAKEMQAGAKSELDGVPRKLQGLVFKSNDKLQHGIPKVSDVKFTLKWDKNKGKKGAWVIGSNQLRKSNVFPNLVFDGKLGKAINSADTHTSAMDAMATIKELVQGDAEKAATKEGYIEFMQKVGASSNGLVVPSTLDVALNDPAKMTDWILGDRLHGKRKIETRQNAIDGLDGTKVFREAIGEDKAPDPRVAALLHMWGILSRMLPPLDQEGMWLRLLANPNVIEAINRSVDGTFNETVKGEYKKISEDAWKALVTESVEMTLAAETIGKNATSNANDFYDALKRLDGKWDQLANSFATSDASTMRKNYWDVVANNGSLGIKNKVVSFMGLTTGIPTWVGDRWQYVFANLPMLERLTGNEAQSMFKYDRYNVPEDPTSMYAVYGTMESDNPVFSNLLYEYINTSLQNAFDAHPKAYKEMLGDHVNASGFHWVTWNAIKNEPVGHSSLSILLELQQKSKEVKTLEDLTDLIMGSTTYTEGRTGGKNVRLEYNKGKVKRRVD